MKKMILALGLVLASSQALAANTSLITSECANEIQDYVQLENQVMGNPHKPVPEHTIKLLRTYKESVVTACRFYYGQNVGFENTPSVAIFRSQINEYLKAQ